MELLDNGHVRLTAEEAAGLKADPDGMAKLRKWVDERLALRPRPVAKPDVAAQRKIAAALKLSWPQYQRGLREAKRR